MSKLSDAVEVRDLGPSRLRAPGAKTVTVVAGACVDMAHRNLFAIDSDLATNGLGFKLPPLGKWDLELNDFLIRDSGFVREFGPEYGIRALHGFSDFWVDHHGGHTRVAREVRASFEGRATAIDPKERMVALFAATLRTWPNQDVLDTLPVALVVAPKAEKLRAAIADGATHPADPIFAAGLEGDVAQGLAAAVAAHLSRASGKPVPRDMRWTLVVLLQGYARRQRGPAPAALYALAGALGLLDEKGHGLANLPLGGVIHRRALIEMAAAQAFEEADDDFESRDAIVLKLDPRTDEALRASPIYGLAYRDAKRRVEKNVIREVGGLTREDMLDLLDS